MKTFTETELGLMWCRMNSWKHPIDKDKEWDEKLLDGAMALISTLIGMQKCLDVWNGEYCDETGDKRRKSSVLSNFDKKILK